ncbi:hypothetical protein G9F72_001115 [Clostridium estertheticum]|uniref:hypothetical protein n=1 Tax=Clostridium estertheticum TaxID=238834 RepID=UPI0013E941CA|nr:hypothetical protein [Clostridium estertheticum]MBZ9684960.1 hypothetical protein [Clostridium estertheticum]
MTKIIFKIERHYGNKDLKTIIENLLSMKLSNLKFNSEAYDKFYYNMDNDKKAIIQGASNK